MTIDRKAFEAQARPLAERLIGHAMSSGRKYGITDVRVVIIQSENLSDEIAKGQVSELSAGTSIAISVTIFSGNRSLAFSANTFDEEKLRDILTQNMRIIHLAPETPYDALLEPEKVYHGPDIDLDIYDQNPPGHDELIDYARKVEAAALAQPGIKTTRSTGASLDTGCKLILATNGVDRIRQFSASRASTQVIAQSGSTEMRGEDGNSVAHYFSDMADPQMLGQQTARRALAKLGSVKPLTGEFPVVLSPDAAEDFFSRVLVAISGDKVYEERTFLKDKLGQQVMSDCITVVDNPRIPRGLSSTAVDSAGMEAKEIILIERGVLKSFLVDLKEARQLGIEPMGRQSGETNVSILPGIQTPQALMADIADGIYIEEFSPGTIDVNNGTYSVPARGHQIRSGQITGTAVDEFLVAGDLREIFMSLAIANDTPTLPSTRHALAAPTMRINKVVIAASS